MQYILNAKIVKIEERHEITRVEKEQTLQGEKVMQVSIDLGWFVTLDLGGQRFSFAVGNEKPPEAFTILIGAAK